MAFGVEELRVLRRALALALHPATASAEDVQDCLRLAESLDEATREGVRLRAFLVADLGRYRAALPGTAAGYLTLLEEALGAAYRPVADDLAALRALRGNPVAAALLERCQALAEQDVRERLARGTARRGDALDIPSVPASRTRLLALPGGLAAGLPAAAQETAGRPGEGEEPRRKPSGKPVRPAPGPAAPKPEPARKPVPTPGEVFPRRKPTPPPEQPPQQLAAG
ncbi:MULTISPECIES: hypothetical protein [unclassified Streptomyces]|uniref:hypothetical protein n=1 Tax=unclassified Streptomyces TaxID=2593676 RepID=UPI001F04E2E8|nr:MULTISPECIES: hypothetical protein [unclassified Streptomyces]MCH0565139.1 hypothetical protein [Streptomyces sp. MUM 2J]MCH0571225.1 hypothetical protein [Streptomyces sp. MUM 136J]